MIPFSRKKIVPSEYNHMTLIDELGKYSRWKSTGSDAWIRFDFGHNALKAGHYRLCWLAPLGDKRSGNCCLYVDYGAGFEEHDKFNIWPRQRGGLQYFDFSISSPVFALRLDITDRPEVVSLGDLSLRKVSKYERHGRLLARLVFQRIRSPKSAMQAWRAIMRSFTKGGFRQLAHDVKRARDVAPGEVNDYSKWVSFYDTITEYDRSMMQSIVAEIEVPPIISVVMPVYNTERKFLRDAIECVINQTYPHWELCIANDASPKSYIRELLDKYAADDPRIKVINREENGHISAASNSALELASGEWVALLDHDDLIPQHALFCVAHAIIENPKAKLFYSDEDKIDQQGVRHDPYFKSDFNPILFRSHNMITHLGVYSRKELDEIGGFRSSYDGAQDYDLALRFIDKIGADNVHHIPHILYHWRAIAGSTAQSSDEKPYAMVAGERALNDHLQRNEVCAKAELIGFGYRVHYELPDPPPLVSIIIPTKNGREITQQCIDSILEKTTYENYEIILIDNGSDDRDALDYFAKLKRQKIARVIRDDRPFNYSALNNSAVKKAKGSVICFLNNDIEVITPDWLTVMVSIALQPGTGAVGAKLLYPDDTIQHGGVILGLGGLAAHAHSNMPATTLGYVGRAALEQNMSAVTAACLVVKKDDFLEVNGFNEESLTVAYNDVDLCLKLLDLGVLNVWSPHAVLYHHESATRGYEIGAEKLERFQLEKEYMLENWKHLIFKDPAYNPNLTLNSSDFSLAWPPRVQYKWKNDRSSAL